MAAGMLIRNSLAWHRGGAERGEAAGPDADVQADAGPVVSMMSATVAVIAHRAVRSGSTPPGHMRNTSGRQVKMAGWQHELTGGLTKAGHQRPGPSSGPSGFTREWQCSPPSTPGPAV